MIEKSARRRPETVSAVPADQLALSEALTFDDVLLVPQYSEIRPREADLSTRLTKKIGLKIPVLSAAMDTVTEAEMAIKLALHGGLGVIHKNNLAAEQASLVQQVKRFENGFIQNPVTLGPEDSLAQAHEIRTRLGYKKIPIVDQDGKFLGLLTEKDYFASDGLTGLVKNHMRPKTGVHTRPISVTLKEANEIIRRERIEVLPVLDREGRLTSIVTRSDLEKNEEYPNASKDERKRLRVGAAVGVGAEALTRAKLLAEAGVDVVAVDVAHGHSRGVAEMVSQLKQALPQVEVIGGNVASRAGAKLLASAGADAVKVGVGPGSICSTRVVAGIGVPQLTAVQEAVAGVRETGKDIPVIADGGIRSSGDIVKALAAGAETVMLGRLFAGTEEAPGLLESVGEHRYKVYRGMGSYEAMSQGSGDRYGHDQQSSSEVSAEGVVGRVPYAGSMVPRLKELLGGIRAGCAYNGAKHLGDLPARAQFVKITGAGLQESHPHSISRE